MLALLADCDVLFILSLGFWTVDVTHRGYFAAFTDFDREKILPLLFTFTIYTTIYRFLSTNLYYILCIQYTLILLETQMNLLLKDLKDYISFTFINNRTKKCNTCQ